MAERRALSVTPFSGALLTDPRRRGTFVGHGHIVFGDDVVTLTAPDAPRLPNGIEADAAHAPIPAAAVAWIGDGRLVVAGETITVGPLWDPVPAVNVDLAVSPAYVPDPAVLAGWGPGLTPVGDDLLAGYAAGLALRGDPAGATIAAQASVRTTALAGTLLRLAATGALAEPAHRFTARGDLDALRRFGATSGAGLAVGLALGLQTDEAPARAGDDVTAVHAIELFLPDGTVRFEVRVRPRTVTSPGGRDLRPSPAAGRR